MTTTRKTFTFVLLLLALSFDSEGALRKPRIGPKSADGPMVIFTGGGVEARGLAPRAPVHFVSLSITMVDGLLTATSGADTIVADSAGIAHLAPTALHDRSLWLVVDGATGEYTIDSPGALVLREVDLPGNAVRPASNGLLKRLIFGRYSAVVSVIRPGTGTWTIRVRDGSAGDDDGKRDGGFELDLSTMPSGSAGAPFDRLKQGDLLFIIDPLTLEFFVSKQGAER